jgi:hypothetical protein
MGNTGRGMTAETQTLVEIGRGLVLIAMVAAAAAKSLDVRSFAEDLGRSFAWLQDASARVFAFAILVAEWLIAILIALGSDMARIGLLAALALLSAFTVVVAWSVVFDRGLVCSCFGASSSHRMNGYDLARNMVLVAAAAYAWLQPPARDVVQTIAGQPAPVSIALTAAAAIVFLLITSLQDIALLLRIDTER